DSRLPRRQQPGRQVGLGRPGQPELLRDRERQVRLPAFHPADAAAGWQPDPHERLRADEDELLMRRAKSRGQAMVEFALLSGLLFLMVMGIFDFGRAISIYVNIAEAAHEGARQLVLRSNYYTQYPDAAVVNATLAKIGGGGMVLTEDPCLAQQTPCTSPGAPPATAPNTGYIWISPNRTTGNHNVTVRVTYQYAPLTGMISSLVGAQFIMTAGSSMRSAY